MKTLKFTCSLRCPLPVGGGGVIQSSRFTACFLSGQLSSQQKAWKGKKENLSFLLTSIEVGSLEWELQVWLQVYIQVYIHLSNEGQEREGAVGGWGYQELVKPGWCMRDPQKGQDKNKELGRNYTPKEKKVPRTGQHTHCAMHIHENPWRTMLFP